MPRSGFNATNPAQHPVNGTAGPRPDGPGRPLAAADLPEVARIERECFNAPWTPGMLQLETSRPGSIGLVVPATDGLAGYIVLSRYGDAWHLMKIAVRPENRKQGIGSLLLDGALELAGELPVTLEVRSGNRAALALYERFGFVARGRRRGYYTDNGEDALLMWRGDPALAGVPAESLELPVGS